METDSIRRAGCTNGSGRCLRLRVWPPATDATQRRRPSAHEDSVIAKFCCCAADGSKDTCSSTPSPERLRDSAWLAHIEVTSRVSREASAAPSRQHRVYFRRVPDVARIGAYRFFFYSNERDEPPHIHVRRERKVAKFWLHEVSLAKSRGFAAHELRELERMVVQNQHAFLRSWNERNPL